MIVDVFIQSPYLTGKVFGVSWLYLDLTREGTEWFEWAPYSTQLITWEFCAPVPEDDRTFEELQVYVKSMYGRLPDISRWDITRRYPDRIWEHEYVMLMREMEDILGC